MRRLVEMRGLCQPLTPALPSVVARHSSQHALPAMVLSHRKVSKLLTTYVRPLKSFAVADPAIPGRFIIRTSLNQCNTGTGRLSSSDPNLQNLPTSRQSDDAAHIRKAFVPRGTHAWPYCALCVACTWPCS